MFNMKLFLLTMAMSSLLLAGTGNASRVKAVYWFDGSVALSSVDSSLFTHLLCAFAGIDSATFHVTIPDSSADTFSKFTSTLQLKNPRLKTLLSIGGGGSNATDFATMTASSATRKAFIDSSISTARSYNFHGLDLDYEFPTTATHMADLATFLSEWRAAVKAESSTTKRPPLLLTAAVYYTSVYHEVPLPAAAMARSLDWINVMAYDFYGPGWSTVTRPTAALYDPSTPISGSNGVNAWISAGVPASKVVMGFPFYGRAWQLADAADHGYFAATKGALPGYDGGAMTYKQIRELISENKDKGLVTVYNATTVESYSYVEDTWVAYDDVEAIAAKMRFVREKRLLGYFAWHVGADDNSVLAKTAARCS